MPFALARTELDARITATTVEVFHKGKRVASHIRRYQRGHSSHAVPLDERAVAALVHSALGLDLYAWLAQRLHRVEPRQPVFVPWPQLKEQFGPQYARLDNFKRVFFPALDMVLTQYRGARIGLDGHGLTLRHSAPPVKGRFAVSGRG